MTDQKEDLRQLILNTTRHLLVRDGYKSVSMRKIARAIGYSATSIYLHFESKDALFHALIDEGMQRLYRAFRTVAEGYADPIERLRALCQCYVEFGLREPETYEIMFLLHAEHMERYPPESFRRARRNLEMFVDALEEGADAGLVNVDDPRVTAAATWATLHGAVSLLIAQRVDVRIDQAAFIETAIEQAMLGITARKGAEAVAVS